MSALQSTVPNVQPSPAHFFDTVQSFQNPFILKAGVDLDIFTAIAQGHSTAREIATERNVPERGIRVICDCLTVLGFLNKRGDRYTLAPESAPFLDSRSPVYLGHALKFLLDPSQLQRMQGLTEAVRRGGPPEDYYMHGSDERIWVDFAKGMAPLMFTAAQAIAQSLRTVLSDKPAKVLDGAAGHGTFGITVGEQFPKAQIYALDLPAVLEVAKEHATARGVNERYHLLPGSAFDVEWGAAYDAVLLTNFLHHFDFETNVQLLRKAHAALRPGGQVVLLEFVTNEDRVSPPVPAMFSVVMFSGTKNGDAYPFSQLSAMCVRAGFSEPKLMRLDSSPESIVTAKK